MVQESIVEYINAQMKLGVSRDAIKTTLTGAGWVAADVEDTLKKIEAAKVAQPIVAAAAPVTVAPVTTAAAVKPAQPVGASSFMSKPLTPANGTVNAAPQTIRVSDLVSASPASAKPATMPVLKSSLTGPAMIKNTPPVQATSYSAAKPHGSHVALITDLVFIAAVVAIGSFAAFLYVQNRSLNTQLGSLNGQSSGVNSQLSALQAQVAASTTALTAQVSSLNAETQELQTELTFYVAPSSTVPGATSTATIGGTVSGGGKALYAITAMYGAKVYVANSKVAGVITALAPVMATMGTTSTPAAPAATAQFSGIYVPGSDSITLTAVNGTAIH